MRYGTDANRPLCSVNAARSAPSAEDVGMAARLTSLTKPLEPTTILVVEDHAGVLEMLDYALKYAGFAVHLASDGRQALELFRAHHENIHVVLLDVQMPEQDGPSILKAFQGIDSDVRCCFMCSQPGDFTYENLYALGATHVLVKPFASLDILYASLLEAARGESTNGKLNDRAQIGCTAST
jgi:two-component system cell cycle sensor histidine kinase/response regulator CckA